VVSGEMIDIRVIVCCCWIPVYYNCLYSMFIIDSCNDSYFPSD
jgi:hypothetical protein